MKEKIFDIRFLVPPILTIFFVFLFSPSSFLNLVCVEKISSIIAIGVTGILGLGFLISSITEFFVTVCNLRDSNYGPEDIKDLENIYKFWGKEILKKEPDKDLLELISWIILDQTDKQDKSHLWEQINKRWSMAMANFNSVISIVFAWIALFFISRTHWLKQPSCFWFFIYILISIAFIIIFIIVGANAYKSVVKMDRYLVKYARSLRENSASINAKE